MIMNSTIGVSRARVSAYRFPTVAGPESDGTLTWDSTVAVVVEIHADGHSGLGWTYSDPATASLITGKLLPTLDGHDPLDVAGCWQRMVRACRNLGRPGLVSQAIAAVDIALWDLKARVLQVPLHRLFGATRDTVPVYGSGGFVSMTDDQLRAQIDGWLAAGCTAMKIKIAEQRGANPVRDMHRVALLNSHTPDGTQTMVDANGGYTPGQARRLGAVFDALGVVWFEEPLSSDDLRGLASLRGCLRADVAAGEYGDSVGYAEQMCGAGAVDCLQLDVTRCAGYSEWLRAAAVAAAHHLDVSAHCAPSLHASVAAAVPNLRHVEWFSDHAHLEPLMVDGSPRVRDGHLLLTDRPGHGMRLRPDADHYRVA